MNFKEYIASTLAQIKKYRRDITHENSESILHANIPFEIKPSLQTNKACLLIHGLYDSPHTMRDLTTAIAHQGYLTRAILLPGHGTNPDDLHKTKLEQWQAEVSRHINELQREVDDITLLGFSAGGALALDFVLSNPKTHISKLVLLAPALKINSRFAPLLGIVTWLSNIIPPLKWLKKIPSFDYARYSRHSTNGAYQVYRLTKRLKEFRLEKLPPSLWITCNNDAVINSQTIHDLFDNPSHRHKLICYTNCTKTSGDTIAYRSASYPELDIIDFSHLSLCVSPSNPHWGIKPDFEQCVGGKENTKLPLKYGEATPENLKHYRIIRLKYNPDFDAMTQTIIDFLKNYSVSPLR